jgi:hypothetical protein
MPHATASPPRHGVGLAVVRDIGVVYAAVIATAALTWQVWIFLQGRRHRVDVGVAYAIMGKPLGPESVVVVSAVNRSDRVARVTSCGLYTQEDPPRQWVAFRPDPLSSLPGTVEPNDVCKQFIGADLLVSSGFDLHEPLRSWAWLATGELVESEPRRLLALEAADRESSSTEDPHPGRAMT